MCRKGQKTKIIKLSHYKPEEAHRVPGGKAPRFLDIGT
jgi:hypothetical protein